MKVGYFVETPVEHNLTGGSRSFLDLLEQLVPMGVEPFVVVHEPWALTKELEQRGIPFITTKMYRPFVSVKDKVRFCRLKYLLKCIINYISQCRATVFFKNNGVQLIHINSQFCGVIGAKVAQKLKLPYIYHIREFLEDGFGVTWYNKQEAYSFLGKANVMIAISDAIYKHQKELFKDSNIIKVYNGIDYKKFECLPKIKHLTGNIILMAIVGRICDTKNQWDAVKAVERLLASGYTNIKLLIIGYMGKDQYELNMNEYVQQHRLGKYIEFVPFTNNIYDIIKKCDIGIMCSVAEAFGRVTIEYMMTGLLTIGADIGGTSELIKNKFNGLLYPPRNHEQLKKQIIWAIEHVDEANRIALEGQRSSKEKYSIEQTAKKILSVYENTLNI